MIFQHHRFQIWNQVQHPYSHSLADFLYSNPSLPPGVTSVEDVLNYILAVLYPQTKPSVATPAALPLVGNTINDYRIVLDDGDGKSAAYRWEQREGDATPTWYKVGDIDFGLDSILQQWNLDTLSRYVSKFGHDDLDSSGVAISGNLAGQRIYGGVSANTHLTLYANAGDGVGPRTGFIQFGDDVRPTANNSMDLGTGTYAFKDLYLSNSVKIGTTTISSGLLDSGTGAWSFNDADLQNIDTITVGATDNLVIEGTQIYTIVGPLGFNGTALDGITSIDCDSINAPTSASTLASGSNIGDFIFSGSNLTHSLSAINTLTTSIESGTFLKGATLKTAGIDITTSTITTSDNAYDLTLTTLNAAKKLLLLRPADFSGLATFAAGLTLSGGNITLNGGGSFIVNDLTLNSAATFSTTATDITFAPTGDVKLTAHLVPTSNNTYALGSASAAFSTAYLDTSISNGTNSISMTTVLSMRHARFRDTAETLPAQNGDTLTYDSVNDVYLATDPNTAIDHTSLTNLTTGDAGHTQFALLAGRAGGQTLNGGTAASENLILDSTAHATKGKIRAKSGIVPDSSTLDLGSVTDIWRDVYTSGQFIGFRLENLASTPGFNPLTPGRLIYNTTEEDVYLDTGSAMKRLNPNRYSADTSWNGSDTTKTVTVTDVDARFAVWQLKDNSNNYEIIYCKMEALSATSLRITVDPALPAGSYRLTGVE